MLFATDNPSMWKDPVFLSHYPCIGWNSLALRSWWKRDVHPDHCVGRKCCGAWCLVIEVFWSNALGVMGHYCAPDRHNKQLTHTFSRVLLSQSTVSSGLYLHHVVKVVGVKKMRGTLPRTSLHFAWSAQTNPRGFARSKCCKTAGQWKWTAKQASASFWIPSSRHNNALSAMNFMLYEPWFDLTLI